MGATGKARAALDKVRAVHDKQTSESGNGASTLRSMDQRKYESDKALRHQQGSDAGSGKHDGRADMKTCMSCDKFDCSEMTVCDRWDYCPGTDA